MMFETKFRGVTLNNQRKNRRVAVDLAANVDGEDVIVKDISFGGMGFIAEDADIEVGDDVLVEIDLGEGKRLKLGGVILWSDEREEYGMAFTGLTPEAFQLIEDLQTGLDGRRSSHPAHGFKTSSGGV